VLFQGLGANTSMVYAFECGYIHKEENISCSQTWRAEIINLPVSPSPRPVVLKLNPNAETQNTLINLDTCLLTLCRLTSCATCRRYLYNTTKLASKVWEMTRNHVLRLKPDLKFRIGDFGQVQEKLVTDQRDNCQACCQ
jgi:hypothetical protein